MKIINRLFSIQKENYHRIINFCFFKIKLKYSNLEFIRELVDYKPNWSPASIKIYNQIEEIVHTALIHQKSFSNLRWINENKNVVICGLGPTLDSYLPIKNAVHIGLKDAYKIKNIKFDYLFIHDATGYEFNMVPAEFVEYREKECIKFIGNSTPFFNGKNILNNDVRFFNSSNSLNFQIDYLALPDFYSIIFSAFAFALWTKPKRIYIVGADFTDKYAKSMNVNRKPNLKNSIKYWKNMKDFAQKYYPDVEIVSINPVGLKGLFTDIYTKDNYYINQNNEKFNIGDK